MSEDDNGWDSEARGRTRNPWISEVERGTCPMAELVAFLHDYPNISDVFIVRRLVAKITELEGELKAERAEMELVRGRSRGDLHTLAELQAQLDRANAQIEELKSTWPTTDDGPLTDEQLAEICHLVAHLDGDTVVEQVRAAVRSPLQG